jgi:hypothetical protein
MTASKIARRLMPALGAITMLAFPAPSATQASTSSPAHVGASARTGAATKHHYTWRVKIRHHKVTKAEKVAIARAARPGHLPAAARAA